MRDTALVVHKEIEIDAPPDRVWPFVATAAGYRRWSCTPANPYEVVLEERAGGRYEERGVVGGEAWTNVGEILAYDPPKRLAFTLQMKKSDGSLGPLTTVTITLATLGGRTRLTLEHDLTYLPPERRGVRFRSFDVGWGHALEELRMMADWDAGVAPEALAVRREIEVDAPLERVWPYVATVGGCRKWFCTVAEHYDLILEPGVGGRYEQRMIVNGTRYHSVGQVLAYDPPRRFIYTSREVDTEGRPSAHTTVSIILTDLGGRARVTVEERGFELLPVDARERIFRSTDQGWAAAMEDLRGLLVQEVLPDLGHLVVYQSTEIATPASRVWEFIATPVGRNCLQRTKYPDSHLEVDVFEAREGGRWESAGISAMTGDRYRQFGRVVRYDPPHLLAYTLQEEGWPAETLVTYRLVEFFGKTRVTLIHSGFEHLPPARHRLTRKAYEIGRYGTLERLRRLVEGREVPVEPPLMIRQEVVIEAPIDRVWTYIGTQEGSIARHRAEGTKGVVEYRDEILEPRPGGRYELRGVFQGKRFRITGQVLAYDPPHALALSWREEGDDGAGWPVDTVVRFRLVDEGGRTRVTVIHHGLEHLPEPVRSQALREYDAGRRRGLDVMRAFLERR